MSERAIADEALLDLLLKLNAVEIDASWRSGILANLAALGRAGELVLGMDLDETTEPAPVYSASRE